MSLRRAAAIDCGTNSIRLLIADVDPAAGRARDVLRELVIVRLGKYRGERVGDSALTRAMELLMEAVKP